MNITHKDVLALARRFSVSEKAIARLLGSVPVELKRALSQDEIDRIAMGEALPEVPVERFNVGLRLGKDNSLESQSAKSIEDVAVALGEYRTIAPMVFAWLQSGDFDAKRIPDRITRGVLMHASRTAGRLRARLLRN